MAPAAVACILLLCILHVAQGADIWTSLVGEDVAGCGQSKPLACKTIAFAIAHSASANDVVLLDAPSATPGGSFDCGVEVAFDLGFAGVGGGLAPFNCGGQSSAFTVAGGSTRVSFDSLAFSNTVGGAIVAQGPHVVSVKRCSFANGRMFDRGAAVQVYTPTLFPLQLLVTQSTFTGNSGPAVSVLGASVDGATVTVRNCSFSANAHGAGVRVRATAGIRGSSITVSDSRFTDCATDSQERSLDPEEQLTKLLSRNV
jgi:hypothetical protein